MKVSIRFRLREDKRRWDTIASGYGKIKKTEPHFSKGDGGAQNGSISRRRSWITDRVGNPKPTVGHRFPKQRPKASGCDSAIKSRKSCGGQPAQTLPWRAIEQVFRPKTISLGRLCESFEPQTSRWGDCASFSLQNHLVGAIVRVFQATDFPVGRLCESFAPKTSRWGDCARQSFAKKPFRGCDFLVQFTG